MIKLNNSLKKLRINNSESEQEIADILNLSVSEYLDKEEGLVSLTNGEKKVLNDHFNVEKF